MKNSVKVLLSLLILNFGIFTILIAQNNCLDFDGVNEYVDIGTGPTTVQSVEFWVYPTTTTEYFIDLNGSAYISSSSGNISATNFTSPTIYVDGIVSSTIVSGKWQHIAVTTGTNIDATDLDIGRLEGQEEFDGKIDEVRLWSDVRTATEIRANMYKEFAGTETGLVAYYKLNETTGTTADNAEGTVAYDGTLTGTDFTFANSGGPSGAFSGPGNCLSFDGVDEYVDIGTGPTTVQSVEFWVYPTTTTEYFIDLNGSAYISSGSGTISATGFTSPTIYVDGIESTTIESGKWQHVAVTTGTIINATDLDIGRLEGQEEFDGKIDEVRLWSDVRTAMEIRDNMCRTLDGGESGLVAYYRFDHKNTSGQTTLYDITSNENHGTLTNMEANADWVDCEAFDTWIGFYSSDWATPGNWSDGVPAATDNIGIPYWILGHSPTLSGNPTVNNIVIGLFATLNLSSDFTVNRHYFKLGTLSPGTNTVIFGGSSKQFLVGTNLGFYNLTINNTHAGDKVSAWWCTSLSVSNNLTITDGIFYSKSDYKNVSIGTNGTLELSGDITVSGNWDSDGTFTHNNHTVTFDGSSTQTIQGDNTTTFFNLTINSGAVVNINAETDVTVNSTLTNSAGTSGLVIKSDATGTGSLIHNTTGVNATVERYLTKMQWHFIGIPIASEVAGVFHLPGGHSDIYLKTHNEYNNTWGNFIYEVTTPLILGHGYECWVGNATFNQDETIEFEGALNAGDYTTGSGNFYDLEYTTDHGLNLISNPYPSALEANINTTAWAKTNIVNSVWTWDGTAGNYVYWNGIDTTGAGSGVGSLDGGIIPSMQAFFVLANGTNPSLTIPQSSRVHSSQAYYKGSSGMTNTIRLDIEGNGYKDAIFISFNGNATDGYDSDFDVKKLFGLDEAPQLYSVIPGKNLSINSMSDFDEYKIVDLGFECSIPELFTIEASEIESFKENITIYLEDIKEGIMFNLSENPSYTFNHEIGDDPNRFLLHFGEPNSIDEPGEQNIRIYSNENIIYIQQPAGLQGEIVIYNILGQEIKREKVNNIELIRMKVTNGTGYYIVKVKTGKQLLTQKVFIR